MAEKVNKSKSGSRDVLVQGSILAVAGIITRIIGLVKRVPLANIITDVGNSYYSCAYEIYTIVLMISSYSLPLAISKMVSQRVAKGEYRNARKVFRISLGFAVIVGLISFGFIFAFAREVSAWFDEPKSALALMILAPTLLIVAIMGVFRGYFQGMGTMVPTAMSQILEQIFVVACSLLGAHFFMKYGVKAGALLNDENFGYAYGAGGAAIGPGIGALVGLAFLVFVFFLNKSFLDKQVRRDVTYADESYKQILKIVLLTIFPVVLSSFIYHLTNIVDQKLYHNTMIRIGMEATKSRNWGAYTGKYKVLLSVPIAIANAMCSTITPTIAGLFSKRDRASVKEKINVTMRFVAIISIPSAVGLSTLARPIVDLLFNGEIDIPVRLLQFGAITVVFYSVSTLMNGILQGINKLNKPVIHSAISLVIHCIIGYLLIRYTSLNIYGIAIADGVFALLMCVMNYISIHRELHYTQEIDKTFVRPLLAALAMGVFLLIMNFGLRKLLGNLLTVLIALPIAVVIYFVVLILLKGLDKDELLEMPYGRKLYGIFHKVHLM